jgi:hypothetical protein
MPAPAPAAILPLVVRAHQRVLSQIQLHEYRPKRYMMRSHPLPASVFLGQRRGTLSYKLVPTAIEGASSPEGTQRACERSTPRSGVDGERGRGSLSCLRAALARSL